MPFATLLMMELVACRFGSAVVLATSTRSTTTTAPPNNTPSTTATAQCQQHLEG